MSNKHIPRNELPPRGTPIKEESYDDGRLFLRQFAVSDVVGCRVEHLTFIWGDGMSQVKTRHDNLEAAERKERAGLPCAWGTERVTPAEKRRIQEGQKLAREWLTRKWGT